jgi:hypothetical protein
MVVTINRATHSAIGDAGCSSAMERPLTCRYKRVGSAPFATGKNTRLIDSSISWRGRYDPRRDRVWGQGWPCRNLAGKEPVRVTHVEQA